MADILILKPQAIEPGGLSKAAAAKYLGVGLNLLDELIRSGAIRVKRPGRGSKNRRVIIPKTSLDAWLAE